MLTKGKTALWLDETTEERLGRVEDRAKMYEERYMSSLKAIFELETELSQVKEAVVQQSSQNSSQVLFSPQQPSSPRGQRLGSTLSQSHRQLDLRTGVESNNSLLIEDGKNRLEEVLQQYEEDIQKLNQNLQIANKRYSTAEIDNDRLHRLNSALQNDLCLAQRDLNAKQTQLKMLQSFTDSRHLSESGGRHRRNRTAGASATNDGEEYDEDFDNASFSPEQDLKNSAGVATPQTSRKNSPSKKLKQQKLEHLQQLLVQVVDRVQQCERQRETTEEGMRRKIEDLQCEIDLIYKLQSKKNGSSQHSIGHFMQLQQQGRSNMSQYQSLRASLTKNNEFGLQAILSEDKTTVQFFSADGECLLSLKLDAAQRLTQGVQSVRMSECDKQLISTHDLRLPTIEDTEPRKCTEGDQLYCQEDITELQWGGGSRTTYPSPVKNQAECCDNFDLTANSRVSRCSRKRVDFNCQTSLDLEFTADTDHEKNNKKSDRSCRCEVF